METKTRGGAFLNFLEKQKSLLRVLGHFNGGPFLRSFLKFMDFTHLDAMLKMMRQMIDLLWFIGWTGAIGSFAWLVS